MKSVILSIVVLAFRSPFALAQSDPEIAMNSVLNNPRPGHSLRFDEDIMLFPAVATADAPVCRDGEELFRLQLLTGECENGPNPWAGAPVSYRIFTDSTDDVHAECHDCRNEPPGTDVQLCLPKDGCHTAAVGRSIGRWVSCFNGRIEELVMTWGGNIIHQNNAYMFDSVDFGDGCEAEARCGNDQSEFEFFLARDGLKVTENPFEWALNEVTSQAGEIQQPLYQGAVPYPYNQSTFVYDRLCVPLGSCFEFSVAYPLDDLTERLYDPSPFSVRLDGVVYGENKANTNTFYFNNRVKLGTSCTAGAVCNPKTENLVELKFKVNSELKCKWSDFDLSSAVVSFKFPFWLTDQINDDSREYYVESRTFQDFEADGSYAFVGCIPNDRCAELYVGNDIVGTYKVFQDGGEVTQREVHTDEDSVHQGMTATKLGCCMGLSSVCSSGLALQLPQGIFVVVVVFAAFMS